MICLLQRQVKIRIPYTIGQKIWKGDPCHSLRCLPIKFKFQGQYSTDDAFKIWLDNWKVQFFNMNIPRARTNIYH